MTAKRLATIIAVLVLALQLAAAGSARAEAGEVRLARQYGLSYLPLIVMEQQQLVEKYALKAGLRDVRVNWYTLGSGAAMNDALLSRSIDFASGGVAPMITIWAKTKGNVRGLAALDAIPIFLNTTNQSVKGVADLGDRDRIALPAVKVSIQAVVLQMAAARQYGDASYDRFDHLTVAMKHPDAMTALLSGKSEITGHVTSPPFMFQELKNRRVHTVLNSFDLLGGPHTFDIVWTTGDFYRRNPKLAKAVLDALDEAVAFIRKNPRGAAELYLKAEKSSEPISEVLSIIGNRNVGYSTTPVRTKVFADFLYRTGAVKLKANDWKDLFLPLIHDRKGS